MYFSQKVVLTSSWNQAISISNRDPGISIHRLTMTISPHLPGVVLPSQDILGVEIVDTGSESEDSDG